jgi:Na+-transporting methylmalonyl-CoA/oxaloacetate decarboxylase gamma subunit
MFKHGRTALVKLGLSVLFLGVKNSFSQIDSLKSAVKDQGTFESVGLSQGGIGTTILLIFALIALLLWIFRFISSLMIKKEKESELSEQDKTRQISRLNSSDEEVSAAISMALYMYTNQIHDQENPVITMIKVSRTYSPWSSKIYGLRKSPR